LLSFCNRYILVIEYIFTITNKELSISMKPSITEVTQAEADFVVAVAGYGLPISTAARFAGFTAGHGRNLVKKRMIQAGLRALHCHLSGIVAKLDHDAGY
jgi:hypothetical protein